MKTSNWKWIVGGLLVWGLLAASLQHFMDFVSHPTPVMAAEETQANVLANRTIARFTSADVPFAEEFQREGPVLIQEVRVTFSAEATAGNFNIGYDSSGGVAYDGRPWRPDMAGEQYTTWEPENGATLDKDSALTLDFANATTLTIGVEVVYISF